MDARLLSTALRLYRLRRIAGVFWLPHIRLGCSLITISKRHVKTLDRLTQFRWNVKIAHRSNWLKTGMVTGVHPAVHPQLHESLSGKRATLVNSSTLEVHYPVGSNLPGHELAMEMPHNVATILPARESWHLQLLNCIVWLTSALSRGAPASAPRRRLQRFVGPSCRSASRPGRPFRKALRRERHHG